VRKGKDGAVALYARAVEAEQSGRLNDALRAYRLAFKADDNVDKLYARAMARNAAAAAAAAEVEAQEAADVTAVVDPSAPAVPDYDFRREIQVHPDHGPAAGRREKGLRVLLRAAPADAAFAPADEALPLPLARLPPELLEPVLSHLDVAAIEALGATCWRARALTADAGVWRRIASAIYRPPMVPPGIGGARELARRHGDYRTALVEEERIRLDGCYISVCHYIRPGAGEEWVAVTHMSEYSRLEGR
jgi:F-box protein 9